jgi:putative tryptophan/tyrosine transport system substrate-binding protein
MRRREFIAGLGGTAAAWPLAARAQRRTRLPVIGVLWWANAPFPTAEFGRGLSDEGFIIGENVVIDFEIPVQFNRLHAHAAELVGRGVDVIFVAPSPFPIQAVKSSTTTIPIVFLYGGDPVADGFVASLSRPNGNVTGVTSQDVELTNKRFEFLHELVPRATAIGFLTTPVSQARNRGRAATLHLGLDLLILEAVNDRQIGHAFIDIAERHAEALLVDRAAA